MADKRGWYDGYKGQTPGRQEKSGSLWQRLKSRFTD